MINNRLYTLLAAAALTLGLLAPVQPLLAQAADAASAAPAATAPATTAPAADSAAPQPPAPIASTEVIDNPYGLAAAWRQSDWVARFVLILLVVMSMGSWYILITKLWESMKISKEARMAREDVFKAASLQAGAAALKEGSAFRYITETGITAGERHQGTLTQNIDRNTWVMMKLERSISDVQSRLQDGLAFLATVGSTAPFIGLFGTVWGIYHALTAIGISGQASIDKVAGPVGEALIVTAIGLAVAVPAVLGYNLLVRRNKVTMDSVRAFGADVHASLMGAGGPAR